MNTLKLAPVAAILLASMASAPSHAFDQVTWIWNADVTTNVATTAVADLVMTPTGLNQAENRQEAAGSIDSISTLDYGAPTLVNLTLSTNIGSLESSAQSVGNNGAISSDVQAQYDSFQSFTGLPTDALGVVASTSTVTSGVNAGVTSKATSVANTLSVSTEYLLPTDALSLGNNEQFALADVSALSSVTSTADLVSVALLTNPSVTSEAAAIGNNFTSKLTQAATAIVLP